MWQKYKTKNVQVLALAIQEGVPDPNVNIKMFRKRHGLTYPILSDEKATIIQKFGFGSIPSNVVIDKQGKYIASVADVPAMILQIDKLASASKAPKVATKHKTVKSDNKLHN